MTITKQQKQIVVLVVLLLAMAGVLGNYFLSGRGGEPVELTDDVVVPGETGVVPGSSAGFLPDGFELDLSVLADPRFKGLVPPAYPTINSSEVGANANPFTTGTSTE